MSASYKERFRSSFFPVEDGGSGRLSENALWLLEQRYFARRYDPAVGGTRKERTFAEFARRVARTVACAETRYLDGGDDALQWLRRLEGNIFDDMLNRRFLFNSPCLFAAGAGQTVDPEASEKLYREPEELSFEDSSTLHATRTRGQQLFACFVVEVPDSIDGIFDSVKDAAVISKFGGGVGANFGHLRERGSIINGGIGGQASGPVSFMETWNTMGAVVVQGGRRRAALMGMLFDDHPDILDFIDAKVDDGRLPYFNISVCVSDRLMRSSATGEDFVLFSRKDGGPVRSLNGAELWNKLCESAWRRGDPGIFFIDRANADNILKLDDTWRIESTNPCVTGDTMIMTDQGPLPARDLVGKPSNLLVNGVGYRTDGFFSTGVKPVFELRTKEGHSLKLTADHKVLRLAGAADCEWVEAADLREGDRLVLHDHRGFAGWRGKGAETGAEGVADCFTARFESLLPCGQEEVFDASVPGVNAFDANGLYVHNCGEQPLPNYTSCNLDSINVEAFVKTGEDGRTSFDFAAFADQVFRSMYYLDLVIDACSYPLDRIGERTRRIRPVGLGLMGLADTAIMLGMRYGSERFKVFCRALADTMGAAALCASVGMVEEMGKEPFPEAVLVEELFIRFAREQGERLFPESWFASLDRDTMGALMTKMRSSSTMPYTLVNAFESFVDAVGLGDERERLSLAAKVMQSFAQGRLRTSRRLSIAPTGSISMLIDASAGIEPNFAWSWTRRIARADGDGQETREFHHKLLSPLQVAELHDAGALSDPVYVTAYDIKPEEHVEVTGIFAGVVDSGISKTVNLPNDATVDQVKAIYRRCYEMGAKGITIYRDGSRSMQPIEAAKKPEKPERTEEKPARSSRVKERPGLVVFGKTIKETTPWGSIYVTLNFDGDEPFEVFATIGKSGSELKAMTEALSRAISIGLRSGGKLEDFIATLKGLSGKEYWLFEFDDKHVTRSIPDAIAVLLERLIGRDMGGQQGGAVCPECGAPLEMISGCEYCFSCGYSPCK